ncbi:MAG: hydrogen peroxide-inducible genes activator [Candidatus Rariloculaceae bacterium]
MNLPSVKQLRYFVALTETEHFGRAAAASFVSQSAFSTAIKELETLLGVRLVDRTNRQVTITAMGQEIAAQARLSLRDIESLVQIAEGQQAPLEGDLRLGIIPTIAPFLLPKTLPRLRRAYPRLRLYLSEDQTERLHAKLLEGELDAVLLALPYELRNTEVLPLFKDRFLLAANQRTELVDPENYRYNQLNAESVLLLEDGHCLRDHAIAACKIRQTEKVSRFAASSLLTLIEMVDADLGITFLPELAKGSALLRNTRVRLYPLKDGSYRTIGMIWRKGSARSDEFKLLGSFFEENHS